MSPLPQKYLELKLSLLLRQLLVNIRMRRIVLFDQCVSGLVGTLGQNRI